MFIDETLIHITAGKGGDGCKSFRREKYVPRGGPDGGNGGRGGHIIIKVSQHVHTLYDIGNTRNFKADSGGGGGGSHCTGKNGKDIIVTVPLGTLVKDHETGRILKDLNTEGEEWIAAKGGNGGKGNATFKSATRQTPMQTTPGTVGEKRDLQLELKMVADCGLVGFPNAGKSSLLRRLSKATPKVAGYPFTTLNPILGVCGNSGQQSFVLVDIPGLIEGAAEGKGLGHQFLRHIERTGCICFVLDASEDKPAKQYKVLLDELKRYSPALLEKTRMIFLNKQDLGPEGNEFPIPRSLKEKGLIIVKGSAATGAGLDQLTQSIIDLLGNQRLRFNQEWDSKKEKKSSKEEW